MWSPNFLTSCNVNHIICIVRKQLFRVHFNMIRLLVMLDAHGLLVADLAVRLQGLLRVHLRLMNPEIDLFLIYNPTFFIPPNPHQFALHQAFHKPRKRMWEDIVYYPYPSIYFFSKLHTQNKWLKNVQGYIFCKILR